MDSGASGYFFTKDSPNKNVDPTAPPTRVGTASGQSMMLTGTCELVLPQLPSDLPTTEHVMLGFQENFVGVGPVCDDKCTVILSKHAVNIYRPNGTTLITG